VLAVGRGNVRQDAGRAFGVSASAGVDEKEEPFDAARLPPQRRAREEALGEVEPPPPHLQAGPLESGETRRADPLRFDALELARGVRRTGQLLQDRSVVESRAREERAVPGLSSFFFVVS